MTRCGARLILALAFAAAGSRAPAQGGAPGSRSPLPDGVILPLVVFDVTFNNDEVGRPPQPARKEPREALARHPWTALPLRTYSSLDYVTRARTAIVEATALGLDDRPLLFTCPDNRQPHWGPRMTFSLPPPIAAAGRRFRVTLDVSLGTVTKMGGVSLGPVGAVLFFEDGTVRMGTAEIARFQPSKPIRFEFLIDNLNRLVTVRVNGGEAVSLPWSQADVSRPFHGLRLDGLLPGGHARGPGQIAFDNLKIILDE